MHPKKGLSNIAVIWISLCLILLPMSYAKEEESVYSKLIVNETFDLGRFGEITPILLGGDIISESPEKDDNLNSNVDDGEVKKLEQKTSLKSPFIPFVYAAPGDYGCCANLDIIDYVDERYYCSDTRKPEESVCCPASGYTVGTSNRPETQGECENFYFRPNLNCTELRNVTQLGANASCYVGCCYDVELGDCNPATKDSCEAANSSNLWEVGFMGAGNPCYNTTADTKAIDNCSNLSSATAVC